MKIERDTPGARNVVTAYGPGYVEVGGKRHTASLLVSGERLVVDWPAASVQSLTADHFAAIIELAPQIVLLGTGREFHFPTPAQLAPLHQARIGVEVMDTPAACRTYNILLGEGRNVVAALIVA